MPIETLEEFDDWSNKQSRETCIIIAARAALRAFPLVTHDTPSGELHGALVLNTARMLLSSWVASKFPSREIEEAVKFARFDVNGRAQSGAALFASDAATFVADTVLRGVPDPNANPSYVTQTVVAAEGALGTGVVNDSRFADHRAARDATRAAAFTDTEIKFDEMFQTPIWAEPQEPDWLVEALVDNKNHLESGPEWSFWREWYQGTLIGEPLDWDLQQRVALIENDIWNAGPEAVAEEIDRIRTEWLQEQLPQADRLEFDLDQSEFHSKPIPLNASELVETTLKQVEFARSVAAQSNCGFNSSSTAWLYIDHTLEQCRDDPNAIEQNLEIARSDIFAGLQNDTYAVDAKLAALEQVLDRAVTDLRANHPEVAAAWEIRIQHKLQIAEADQKQMIIEKTT